MSMALKPLKPLDPCPICNGEINFKSRVTADYDKYSCDKCHLIGYGLNGHQLSSLADYKLRNSRKLAFYYLRTIVLRKFHRIKTESIANNKTVVSPHSTLENLIGESIKWVSGICNIDRDLVNINYFNAELCELLIEKCKPYYVKHKHVNLVFPNNYKGIEVLEISDFFLLKKLHCLIHYNENYQNKNWCWTAIDRWY